MKFLVKTPRNESIWHSSESFPKPAAIANSIKATIYTKKSNINELSFLFLAKVIILLAETKYRLRAAALSCIALT
jgi:hypothetical protein